MLSADLQPFYGDLNVFNLRGVRIGLYDDCDGSQTNSQHIRMATGQANGSIITLAGGNALKVNSRSKAHHDLDLPSRWWFLWFYHM